MPSPAPVASLSGVGLMVVWMTLPISQAKGATVGILVTMMILTIGRKFISVAEYSRRTPPSPPLEPISERRPS
jgi:hypothetical protein